MDWLMWEMAALDIAYGMAPGIRTPWPMMEEMMTIRPLLSAWDGHAQNSNFQVSNRTPHDFPFHLRWLGLKSFNHLHSMGTSDD